ncbi:DUF29 domain-containing protein [Verrucomicrobium sp. 3C]|uniref:DUF29 domain-containing protein n=1 Tax=Verrucomicrobium sp. 3C TaxID=1134055 RepID=UPI00036E7CD4|nr:DUF29 domain-containing protein [Verrucomicrobium sp. 3C]
MTAKKLYERDFYAWTQETARLLREGRFGDVDLANLIEEVETLGRSERSQLRSRLETLMEHLLYIAYLTRDPRRDGRGWERTVNEDRRQLPRLLEENPSLKHGLDEIVQQAYQTACGRLVDKSEEMYEQGKIHQPVTEKDLPQACPWKIGELLRKDIYFTRAQLEQRVKPPPYRM